MKKSIIVLLFGLFAFNLIAQPVTESTTVEELTVLKNRLDSLLAIIPDSILVSAGDTSFLVPVQDGKVVVNIASDIVQENRGKWPTDLFGWFTLLASLAVGGKVTQMVVSGRRFYNALKPFFKNTLFLVALVAAAVAAGITFLVGGGAFDYTLFLAVQGWVGMIAVFIYERWFAPKNEGEPDPKAEKTQTAKE